LPSGWEKRLNRYVRQTLALGEPYPNIPKLLGMSYNTYRDAVREGGFTEQVTESIVVRLKLQSIEDLIRILSANSGDPLLIQYDPRPGRNDAENTIPDFFSGTIHRLAKSASPKYSIRLKPRRQHIFDGNDPKVGRCLGAICLSQTVTRLRTDEENVRIQYTDLALSRRQFDDGSVIEEMGPQGRAEFRLNNYKSGLDGQYSIGDDQDGAFQVFGEDDVIDASLALEVYSSGPLLKFSRQGSQRVPSGGRTIQDSEQLAFELAVQAFINKSAYFSESDKEQYNPESDPLPSEGTFVRLSTVFFRIIASDQRLPE
jgi:hypothetical protein